MAVDPKTVEIITKIAIEIVKDEEARNRVLLILLGAVALAIKNLSAMLLFYYESNIYYILKYYFLF